MEKAEAREKERLKQEEKKVCVQVSSTGIFCRRHMFAVMTVTFLVVNHDQCMALSVSATLE